MMFPTCTRLALVSLAVSLAACGGAQPPAESAAPAPAPAVQVASPVTAGWTTTEGITTPESAYFDPASGYIFSSQINGAPDGRDGNGTIVKLNGDGSVVSATFVTGLNAPKGLRACNGTLWTADLNEVVGISVQDGAITSRVVVPDAAFLNDVECTSDGTVYVSDMMGNKVYAVREGTASVFIDSSALEYPNGLLVDGDRLIVANWGKPEADFTTKVPGRLMAFNLATKERTLIGNASFGNIDGVESDGRGGLVISDYLKGTVMQVSAAGESTLLREFKPGAADIGFVASRGVLIVPHMNENQVAAYDVSSLLK
jgi:sugar lactone lactonase YvrE